MNEIRDAALARLQGLLAQLEKDLLSARENDHARGSVKDALMACVTFVDSFQFMQSQALAAPLFNLRIALDDLDRGVRPPIFEPTNDKQRPIHTSAYKVLQAHAIFAVDVLAANRMMPVIDACKKVAGLLQKHGVPVQGNKTEKSEGQTEPWKVIRGWRADASGSATTRKRSKSDQTLEMLKGLRTDPQITFAVAECQTNEQRMHFVSALLAAQADNFGKFA